MSGIIYLNNKIKVKEKVSNGKLFKKQKIKLPKTQNGDPDFEYMENYMKSIYENNVKKHIASLSKCLFT